MKNVKLKKFDIANQNIKDLFDAVLILKNQSEAKMFFRDLLTEVELTEFAERWRTARLLAEGAPYSKIEKQTGLSSRTVARIQKWLKNGAGGYRLVLRRLNQHHHNPKTFAKGLG
jgi:TrpR-related protein YerC/YecD